MPLNRLTRSTDKRGSHRSQSLVFLVPFLLQTFAAVGFTGWISLRSGQNAVENRAIQLLSEGSDRIQQELGSYLAKPQLVNQFNADVTALGILNLDDSLNLERYLWKQMQQFQMLTYLALGTEQGDYIGYERRPNGSLELSLVNAATGKLAQDWATDSLGNRTQLARSPYAYDPRTRPWYQSAVQAKKPVWTDIFPSFVNKTLIIAANQPLYNQQGDRLGVISSILSLAQISEFLRQLKIGQTGQTFILERNGFLVATSTRETPLVFDRDSQQSKRLKAIESSDYITRSTANSLIQDFSNLNQISERRQLSILLDRKRHFIQVQPFRDNLGLDWLIVVIVPEVEFSQQIWENRYNTVLLCLGALLLATLLGITTKKLRDSFKILDRKNSEMSALFGEMLASEKARRESEDRFRAIAEATPLPFIICRRSDGTILYANEHISQTFDIPTSELIGRKTVEFYSDLSKREILLENLDREGYLHAYELELKKTDGSKFWVALSLRCLRFNGEAAILSMLYDMTARKQAEEALRSEQEKSERLLLNIFPKVVADRLKQCETSLAEQFDRATILFADIVGFTPLSSRVPPLELVNLLNQIFATFDRLAEEHRLEKIKTIGDAYMVAGGLPVPQDNHAETVADMALAMQQVITDFLTDRGDRFQIRIGINTGSVVAGVMTTSKKCSYDLWGDTVNVASRMESTGMPGRIQVTAATYEYLKYQYLLEPRGNIQVKGKGEMMTYWLKGRKI